MLTEKNHAAEFLLSEGNGQISRKNIILAATAIALVAGTILACQTVGTVISSAKVGGNAGNGVLTVDATTPALAGAKVGVYTVRCTAAAANGGTFEVQDPDGYVLGAVPVGGTFADDIKFSIADGAADFIVNDGFDIVVSAASGEYVAYSDVTKAVMPACAVLYDGAPISLTAQRAVGIVTQAEVIRDRLTGLTASAAAALETHGIFIR